ncbi:MAG: tRNA (cytidine(34)-2'-O)-methyltransferase [Bacteriovoracaceae bacterium]|jgi:tRNA (cytidine/uridine-2'-O-)-methyltransferase|nr:tRNA (cytidine(34)-2'-O)-methyltransferase [Bacteriovoracaceae bacterium]
MAKFSIVLVAPDIPGNTGSIGRTCVALDIRLILIKPYGFSLDQKSVRRAGLDYWKHVQLTEYDSFDQFISGESLNEHPENLFFFSRFSETPYFNAKFTNSCYLVFGSETSGLPDHISTDYPSNFFSLPMFSSKIRSLNLSNAATAVAYESVRQIDFV